MASGIAALALVLGAFGCSDNILDDDRAVDTDAPEIIITKPARGTVLPDRQVEVEGRVVDDDSEVREVTVNGEKVFVDADGRFSALVQLGDGITLIRTIAIDGDDNEGTDSRSVLAGNLVPPDTVAFDAAAGRIGRQAFDNVNQTMINLLEDRDEVTDFGKRFNPVMDAGNSCFGVILELTSISMDDADVEILPVAGGVSFHVDLTNLEILMNADFEVACLGGSSGIDVTADRATITGRLDAGMDRGSVYVELGSIDSSFVDIDIDVGVVRSEIIETFLSDLEGIVGRFVENMVRSQVRKLVDGFVSDFARGEWEVMVGNEPLIFGAVPTELFFDSDGGFLAVDTTVRAANPVDSIGYVATPSADPVSEMRSYENFRAVIADDFVNQALSAYWSSGALARRVAFDSKVEDKESFLGNAIDRVEVTVLLPPYVDARDERELSITVGDVILDIINETAAGDQIVTSLALSGRLTLAVDVDDDSRLELTTDAQQLWVDILDERDGVVGANPFSRDEIEVLVSFVAGRFVGAADDLIGQIPIPSLAGTTITEAQLAPDRGYLTVGGALSVPGL